MKLKQKIGTVYLVGAGPGHPGLLTVRGAALLKRADVIVYDSLVHPRILEENPQALKIFAGKKKHFLQLSGSFPANGLKEKAYSAADQASINRLLVDQARKGLTVVRLKGGDPFVFGRGGEEISHLRRANIPYEVVPGVSAGFAVPAYAGIPVTDRRLASSVAFVTGHEEPGKKGSLVDWPLLAQWKGTIVVFMSAANLPRITQKLVHHGMSPKTGVMIAEWGTLPVQRTLQGTLGTIAQKMRQQHFQAPALAVIGEVTRLRSFLRWYEKLPLYGKTILITRAQAQAGTLRDRLEELGARVLEYPAIEIADPKNWGPLDDSVRRLPHFDWVLFTSVNGVENVFRRLKALGRDARAFAGVQIGVIGQATQEALASHGLNADLVPSSFTSEALLAELHKKGVIPGASFLLPRTDIAPDLLPRELERGGGRVCQVTAYRTLAAKSRQKILKKWLRHEKIDYALFTSASTVRYFFDALTVAEKKKIRCRLIAIGPVTAQAVRASGGKVYREAKPHTLDGLIKVLCHGR